MDTALTSQVVRKYFADLEHGDLPAALAALAPDIEFDLPRDRWNQVIPYLGRHVGVAAVERAFAVRAETTEVLDYGLRDLRAEGDTAYAVIYTRGAHTRTREVFEITDAHRLVVRPDGLIASWTVYFDPNGEVAAFTKDAAARLVAAAWAGDTPSAAEALAAGADPDARDPHSGLTPLMIAAGRADAELVGILLDAGADVLTSDSGAGASPLHKACQGGSLAVVTALVEAGAFVDAVAATTGHTPLMDALWFKFPDVADYLLHQGAGLGVHTSYGFSLAEHFQYELAVNTVGKERLLAAEEHLTARREADAAAVERQRLMAAVTAGDTEQVRSLLAEGAEVDERFPYVSGFNDAHTPLLVAARDGHTDAARLLLEAGADVNATEPTFGAVPLHKAVYNGHVELTRLIAHWPGVELDFQGATNGYTPLHDAIWHGFADCVRVLLEAGPALDLLGHDGKTPHDLAVEVFGADDPLTGQLRAAAA